MKMGELRTIKLLMNNSRPEGKQETIPKPPSKVPTSE
jgi:hypothetical protein